MDFVPKNFHKHHAESGGQGFITKLGDSHRQLVESIFDLDFADDIACLERIFESAQFQLTLTARLAAEVGLQVNIKKTEAFTNQQHTGLNIPIDRHEYIQLDGQQIEWVTDFKYLGSMVASSEHDIQIRKGQAWDAFWKMKDVFRSNTINIGLKKRLFQATCLAILLYGCESWILNNKLEKSLNSFATNCYRVMLGIKRLDKTSNKEVYKRIRNVAINSDSPTPTT